MYHQGAWRIAYFEDDRDLMEAVLAMPAMQETTTRLLGGSSKRQATLDDCVGGAYVRSCVREAADRGVSKQAWCGRVFTMSTEKNVMHERQPAAHNRVARTFCEVNVTACLTHVRILESRDPRSCHLGSSCARMTAVATRQTRRTCGHARFACRLSHHGQLYISHGASLPHTTCTCVAGSDRRRASEPNAASAARTPSTTSRLSPWQSFATWIARARPWRT